MKQLQSKLTIVLKIFSVLALLYAVYALIGIVFVYANMQEMLAIFYVTHAEAFVSLAVTGILLWIIYTGRDTSALFVPALILAIAYVFILFFNIMISLSGHMLSNIWVNAFWNTIRAVVFLLIAIDARFGFKFALAEAITVAAVSVISTLTNLISLVLSISHIADTFSKRVIFNFVTRSVLSLIFSSSAVIVLFLLRTHIQRKNNALPPPQAEQMPV